MSNMSELDLPKNNAELSNLLVELQSVVTKRSFKTFANDEPIVYEFTQDPALLHQYYRLRKIMYDKVFKVENYNWGEDSYDKISHILVARRGRLCIGGCRIIIREADEKWALPMEMNGFDLRKSFCDLPLNKVRHAEISRLTVMEDSGCDDILFNLYSVIYDKVTSSDIHYLFVKSPYTMARKWRFVANSFGVKTTKIVEGIHPVDETLSSEIKWYLTLSNLSGFCSDNIAEKNSAKRLHDRSLEALN